MAAERFSLVFIICLTVTFTAVQAVTTDEWPTTADESITTETMQWVTVAGIWATSASDQFAVTTPFVDSNTPVTTNPPAATIPPVTTNPPEATIPPVTSNPPVETNVMVNATTTTTEVTETTTTLATTTRIPITTAKAAVPTTPPLLISTTTTTTPIPNTTTAAAVPTTPPLPTSTTTLPPVSSGPGRYVLVSGQTVRPGDVYTLSVTILDAAADVQLSVTLRTSTVVAQNQSTVRNGSTSIISLQIPRNLSASSCSLSVSGTGGLNISQYRSLPVALKTLSIFVQTDKSVYNPSEKVLFRVLTFYSDLKPYTNNVTVTIRDKDSNVITLWLDRNSTIGLFNESLVLSSQPTLGTWTISVSAQGTNYTKAFTVAVYKPTAIQIDTRLPAVYYVNLLNIAQQQNLAITIDAKSLSSGLAINGVVRVNISVRYDNEWTDWYLTNYPTPSRQNDIILNLQLSNGQVATTLLSTQLYDITPVPIADVGNTNKVWSALSTRRIKVVVTVNDTVTNTLSTRTSNLQCSPWTPAKDYSLAFVDDSSRIVKPGISLSLSLQLKRTDGGALSSSDLVNSAVAFSGSCNDVLSNTINYNSTATMTTSGLVAFTLPTVCTGYGPVSAQMKLGGSAGTAVVAATWTPTKFISRDGGGLALSLVSPQSGITAGSTVTFRARTTNDTKSLSYQLLGKGIFVKSERVTFAASKSHDFSVTIDGQMALKLAPKARLLVWYNTPTGEIIAESLDFSVDGAFSNQVSASFSPTTVDPLGSVTVTVNSAAGSYIGLLAVDQTSLLAPGYDVTTQTVLQDLSRYQTENTCQNYDGTQSGGDSSTAVFTMSGVIVMTDAYVYPYHFCGGSQIPAQNSSIDYSSVLNAYLQTWLWTDVTTGANGRATLQSSTPDLVTTWMLTAFSISPTTGLAVTSQPVNITASRQFFMTLSAPSYVIRQEEFGLQVTAFNYLSTVVSATIKLEKSEHFKVRTPNEKNPHNTSVSLKIEISALGSAAVSFWIVPHRLGLMTVYVTGVTASGSTFTASTQVTVVAEGVAQQYSESVLANPPPGASQFVHNFNVTLPVAGLLVDGTVQISVTAVGDLLGPSLDGLGNLLHMPCGCGEQTMIYFAPDVYVLKYLKAVGKATPAIESLAVTYMKAGYQGELRWQRYDKSFSAFGNRDRSGSSWLTAFVAKCFHQAKDYIPLDERNIAEALNWVLRYQKTTGAFTEPGRIIHWDMQGQASGGEPLTAFILISLLENNNNSFIASLNGSSIQTSIDLATKYLENRLASVNTNSYTVSIICYALQLARSPVVDRCLQYLNAMAINDTIKGVWYWKKNRANCPYGRYCNVAAVDVEMTGYALLTYVHRRDVTTSSHISKWIISQRNGYGGFRSTQDTVIALQALAEYAELAAGVPGSGSLNILLTAGSFSHSFEAITTSNALTVQRVEVPSDVTVIEVRATGGGVFGIVQMTVSYSVYVTKNMVFSRRRRAVDDNNNSSAITISTTQTQLTDNEIEFKACASYVATDPSGMCVMEITMPSGYVSVDPSSLIGQAGGNVKNIEVNENTKDLVLYLDELNATAMCVKAKLNRLLAVSNAQPSKVSAYLYYSPDVKAVHEYKSVADSGITWCDQCPTCCSCSAPNYFTCDGTVCRSSTDKCNKVANCLDGTDEIGCSSSRRSVDVAVSTILLTTVVCFLLTFTK